MHARSPPPPPAPAGAAVDGTAGCFSSRHRSPASATNSSLRPRTSRSRSISRPISVRRPPSRRKLSTIRPRSRPNESSSTAWTSRWASRFGVRPSARNSCAVSATASPSTAARPPGGGNPCPITTPRTVRYSSRAPSGPSRPSARSSSSAVTVVVGPSISRRPDGRAASPSSWGRPSAGGLTGERRHRRRGAVHQPAA